MVKQLSLAGVATLGITLGIIACLPNPPKPKGVTIPVAPTLNSSTIKDYDPLNDLVIEDNRDGGVTVVDRYCLSAKKDSHVYRKDERFCL
jgi:hypothetical protein